MGLPFEIPPFYTPLRELGFLFPEPRDERKEGALLSLNYSTRHYAEFASKFGRKLIFDINVVYLVLGQTTRVISKVVDPSTLSSEEIYGS